MTQVGAPALSANERQLIELLHRSEASRAQVALATGLSAQAIGNISRRLIDVGLLTEGDPVRGRVGQPGTPLALAADGALFFGLKIGRRLVELALIDIRGQVRMLRQEVQVRPDPDEILAFARDGIAALTGALAEPLRGRIAGLGIATPFRLWDWGTDYVAWRGRDLPAELAAEQPWPVLQENDATAACRAERLFGGGAALTADFLYLYVAHFAGGGLVLDGRVRRGPTDNAGAAGSMPLPEGGQVLDAASVATLERQIGRALPPADSGWDVPDALLRRWTRNAGEALAFAALGAAALCDLGAVVIDGAIPPALRDRLVAETQGALTRLPAAGIDLPPVLPGRLGRQARILGAAALPLTAGFLPGG